MFHYSNYCEGLKPAIVFILQPLL